jgi:putative nucleotidyltransferase with HDIG domain
MNRPSTARAWMRRARHLVARFVTSLRARPIDEADRAFARDSLREEERECWDDLGPADQAESVATGRATIQLLNRTEHDWEAEPDWIAAALLHDIGKTETDLGTIGRSLATVAAMLAGDRRARAWSGAFGRYVNHDELGAQRLRESGARPAAVAWAAAHHRPDLWPGTGIPPEICRLLAAADGEPEPR